MNCNIGKQIFNFRKSKGASQTELANFLGIQSQTVSKWERGICAPDLSKLPQIAAFFGITLDELFGINEKSAKEFAISQIDKFISQKKWKEAAKKSAACAIEFPSQNCFVQKLLLTVSQSLLCNERFTQKFISEAVILGKRAIHETSEPNSKNDMIYNLCRLLYLTKRTEEADFYKEALPSASACRETLDIYKYSGEELNDILNKNISLYYALAANSFWEIANSMGESIVSIDYMKKAAQHYEEAYKYHENKHYLKNLLLSKMAIAKTYFNIGEITKAKEFIEESKIFACKHGLNELYFKYDLNI